MKYPKVVIQYIKTNLNNEMEKALNKKRKDLDKVINRFVKRKWNTDWTLERVLSEMLSKEYDKLVTNDEDIRKQLQDFAIASLADDKVKNAIISKFKERFNREVFSLFGNYNLTSIGDKFIKKLIDTESIEINEFDKLKPE